MSEIDRRRFLSNAAALAAGSAALGSVGAPGLFAAPAVQTPGKTKVVKTVNSLVIIYLRGGADSLNAVVPYRDPDYYSLRPTIAIPSPYDSKRVEGVAPALELSKTFGLHPALAPLLPLYKAGMVAPIVNVGSTHETRSHFDAQDFMEWAAPGIKAVQEGWLNRYLRRTKKADDHYLRAFSPQALLPRSLRGRYSVLAAPGEGSDEALSAFEDLYKPCPEHDALIEKRQREAAEELAGLSPAKRRARDRAMAKELREKGRPPVTGEDLAPGIHNAGVSTIEKLRHLNRILSGSKSKKDGLYPQGALPTQLADIATVLKAGEPLEITAVDYGGWDHHSYQGASNGTQSRMLGLLAQSIAAFVQDLGPERMQRVTILTMTEFGRTVAENGSVGTDHGHGGFMLAVGGKVNGGKVHGKWLGLRGKALYRNRDLQVTTDFRDVFAETLSGMFQYDTRDNDFFPGYDRAMRKPLGLYRT